MNTEPVPYDDFLTQLLAKARGNKIAPGQMGLFGAPPEPAPAPTPATPVAPAPSPAPSRSPQPVAARPTPAPGPSDDKNQPPGKGWVPIPNSYYRGMHRPKAGGGFEYWYPGRGIGAPSREDRRRIDPPPAPAAPPMGHVPAVQVPAHLEADMPRMSFQQAREEHGAANAAAHHVVYGSLLQKHFRATQQKEVTEIAVGVMRAIVDAMRQEKPKTRFEDIPPLKTLHDAENYFTDHLLKKATKILGRERMDAISAQHLRDPSPGFEQASDSVWDMILGQETGSVFHKSAAMHQVYHHPGGNQPNPAAVVGSLRKRGFSAYTDENGTVHANVSPLAPVGAWAREDIRIGGLSRHDEDSVDAHHAVNGPPPDPGQEDTDGRRITGDGVESQISPFGARNHSYTNGAPRFSFPSVDHAAEAAPWHRAQQKRLEADEQQLRAEHPDAFAHEKPHADYKLESARRRAYAARNHAQAHGQIADAAEKYLKVKGRPVP